MLIGIALDKRFGDSLTTCAAQWGGAIKIHDTAVKNYARMYGKLVSATDHRYVKPFPRPAMNIDVVRRLASAETVESARTFIAAVIRGFGGLSYLKCLPELSCSTRDQTQAAMRNYMLPVMLTVVYAPQGTDSGTAFNLDVAYAVDSHCTRIRIFLVLQKYNFTM